MSVVVLVLACPARPATVTSGAPAAICIVILVCLNECTLRCGRPAAFKFIGDDVEFTSQLYPIGKKTFGRKGGFAKIIFGENCLTTDGITCKKL